MKEGKKTTAKRKVSSASSSKRVVPKNQTPRMPAHREEPPKVKKVNVEEINKDFDDVENEDRRLIVFIAIAILVIVGTVIGLLVGCEKRNNDVPEPEKPGTDVVVPEKPDEKGNKEDEGVVTREIVRKVRAVYTGKKTKKSKGKKDNTDDTVTYNVTYYLGEETNVEEVESGKTPPKYVPTGYSACRYYKDSNLEEEYDMTLKIKSNVNIYMDCDAIEYTVDYGEDAITTNPTTYLVTQGEVALSDATYNGTSEVEMYFNGWYLEPEFSTRVNSLNKDLVEQADENNVIHLYAYFSDEQIVDPEEPVEEPTEDPIVDDTTDPEEVIADDVITDDPKLDAEEETEEEVIVEDVVVDEEETDDVTVIEEETEPEEVVTPPEVVATEEVEEDDDTPQEEVTQPPVVTEPEEETKEESTTEVEVEPTSVTEEPNVPAAPVQEEVQPAPEEVKQPEVVEEVKPEEKPVEEVVQEPKQVEEKAKEPEEKVVEEKVVEEKKVEEKVIEETPKEEKKEEKTPEVKVEKSEHKPEVKPEPKPEVQEKVVEVEEPIVVETETE